MAIDTTQPLLPTECMLRTEATKSIQLPAHVKAAYRWNDFRDAFLDRMGRIWYADNSGRRHSLPADPTSFQTIPPDFWHPSSRLDHFHRQHEEKRWEQLARQAPAPDRGRYLAVVDD